MICMGAVTTNLMSFEEFERLDTMDQVELLKGELIRIPPAEFSHNYSAERLFSLLKAALDVFLQSHPDSRAGRVHHEMGYVLPGDRRSWLQPDVSIARRGQVINRFYEGAPLMAFEIVSENDSAKDLDRKVAMYLEHGAAEVWVIYPETRHALVYYAGTESVLRESRSVHSDLLPGIGIPFTEFL